MPWRRRDFGAYLSLQPSALRLHTSFSGSRQCRDDQKQHKDFRVAEVVLEEPTGEKRGNRGQSGRREEPYLAGFEPSPQIADQRDDEPDPDRERRQSAFGGDLQKIVVEMRIDLVDRVGPTV